MAEITAALVAAVVAVVGAAASLVVAKITSLRSKETAAELEKILNDGDGVYYIFCPNCGNKIYLKGQKISREDSEK